MSLNIFSLAQLKKEIGVFPLPDLWLHSSDLALGGPSAMELDTFTAALKCTGLSLTDAWDTLTWVGGDGSRITAAKNVYVTLLPDREIDAQPLWLHWIWSWQLPLKLKLFFWLCARDKLLTWENLQRKGWHGPGFCVLCRGATEDIHHLFIHCIFAQNIWKHTLQHFSLPLLWTGATFTECFSTWSTAHAAPPTLEVLISWHIWLERNKALFEGASPSFRAVCHRTQASFHWQQSSVKTHLYKAVDSILPEGYSVAFFDGAAQSSGLCCGVGGIFKSHPERTTKWFLSCGRGTNTKVELLGLWTTLMFASFWSLDHLQVIGDSKVIIYWINRKCNLQSIHLKGWKHKTQQLALSFTDISFRHLPRSFNAEADALSKRALSQVVGRLFIYHCDRGQESSTSSINLFEI
jgi:ribonuclease HI